MLLMERERSIAQLGEWLDDAARRSGALVLVTGEAGIGKTSLLQEFTKRQSVPVLWGVCDALFTPTPLAPLRDISRQTRGPLLAALNAGATRDVIFNAVLDVLEQKPTCTVFEDVHWADEATLDLIKFLARRLHRTHALLAISYRDDEIGVRHPLRLVIGDLPSAGVRRLPLAPLSELAVAQLAQQAGRTSAGLHEVTGGNPLFVTELLASDTNSVPHTVRDVVLARVARLPPAALELAEVVSVVPGKTAGWLLSEAATADEAAKEACLGIGMVHLEDGGLAFRHELTRRALEDSLATTRKESLHKRILSALVKRGEIPPARLAHHADGARDIEAVLQFAPVAAREAAAAASHREAVAHYEHALQYAEHLDAGTRARLLDELAYEYHLTDRNPQAIARLESGLALWRELGERLREGDSLRWLSRFSWFAGLGEDTRRYADAAIAVLESLPPSPELAMAYSNRAQVDMLANRTGPAIEFAQRAIALAQQLERPAILSHALNNLGTARLMRADDAGWADLERALEIARGCGREEPVARAYVNLGASAVVQRRHASAVQYFSEGIDYCDDRDLDSFRLFLVAWRARAHLDNGDWQGATADADLAVRDPRTSPVSRIPALIVLGLLRMRRGDPDPASPLEEARRLIGPMQELQRTAPLAAALAEAAWLADDKDTIVREVLPVYTQAIELRDMWLAGELAAWLYRGGALDVAPTKIADPYALEISGDWRGAAKAWSALGCTYDETMILALYGDATERRAALVRFEQMGATAVAQFLRRTLRAQGVRDLPRGARETTRRNEYGLTRREAQVLQLMSDGHTNAIIAKRLFLSTKTVDHHVSAVLAKLGVGTRALAIARFRKRPEGDTDSLA